MAPFAFDNRYARELPGAYVAWKPADMPAPRLLLLSEPLSDERVQLNAAGQVEIELETPWRDGTTHQVMSPLEPRARGEGRAVEARSRGGPKSQRPRTENRRRSATGFSFGFQRVTESARALSPIGDSCADTAFP